MQSPGKQDRVDGSDDRIDHGRRGCEGRPGREIDHRPQDRRRQGANGQEDHHQALQRRVTAFKRVGADPCGEGDQLRDRSGRPPEPADVRRVVSPHGFPSGGRNVPRRLQTLHSP